MRLLHVTAGLGTGGAETFLATIAPRIARLGWAQGVASVTDENAIAYKLSESGIPTAYLALHGPGSLPGAVLRLARIIEAFKPDVVQGWMYYGDLLATLAKPLSHTRNARLFWGVRCSDMDLSSYALRLRLTIKACSALSSLPDGVIANSWKGREIHEALGYRPRAWHVVPNGVDGTIFRPDPDVRSAVRQELGIKAGDVVMLHVARVDPMKDHAMLLEAVKRVPEVRLVMVGLGTERLSDGDRILGLGLRRDVPRMLCAGDAIVSSSAFGEGFPNALAEGIAAGLFPITTAVGDAARLIEAGGVLVPPRDAPAMARAMAQVAAMDTSARQAAAAKTRADVLARFSLDSAIAHLLSIYETDAGGRKEATSSEIGTTSSK